MYRMLLSEEGLRDWAEHQDQPNQDENDAKLFHDTLLVR
jgi:hypothetical protein